MSALAHPTRLSSASVKWPFLLRATGLQPGKGREGQASRAVLSLPLRLAEAGGDAQKAMASLVQYTKVGGRRGSRASGPACLGPTDPRPTAQPLCLQAPIQESLINLSDEDTSRRAVESFQGEWPAWAPWLWGLGPRHLAAFSREFATSGKLAGGRGRVGGSSCSPAAFARFYSCLRCCGLCRFGAGRQWRCTVWGLRHPQNF